MTNSLDTVDITLDETGLLSQRIVRLLNGTTVTFHNNYGSSVSLNYPSSIFDASNSDSITSGESLTKRSSANQLLWLCFVENNTIIDIHLFGDCEYTHKGTDHPVWTGYDLGYNSTLTVVNSSGNDLQISFRNFPKITTIGSGDPPYVYTAPCNMVLKYWPDDTSLEIEVVEKNILIDYDGTVTPSQIQFFDNSDIIVCNQTDQDIEFSAEHFLSGTDSFIVHKNQTITHSSSHTTCEVELSTAVPDNGTPTITMTVKSPPEEEIPGPKT